MKFGVLVFPGSNCDYDCYYVLKHVLHKETDFVWHKDRDISKYDGIVIPGGFSYGDYLRTGAIARFSPVMEAVQKHADKGKLVIGICNGFQILCEAGLLPGVLMRNRSLQFICKYVPLRLEATGETLNIPIAHGEGNYYADDKTLDTLEKDKRVFVRYLDNPNGSARDIAGICNEKRNVFGLMPHPERCSEKELGSTDGLRIFQSVLEMN